MPSLRRPGHAPHIEVCERMQGSCVFAGFADKRPLVGLWPSAKAGRGRVRPVAAVTSPPRLRGVIAAGAWQGRAWACSGTHRHRGVARVRTGQRFLGAGRDLQQYAGRSAAGRPAASGWRAGWQGLRRRTEPGLVPCTASLALVTRERCYLWRTLQVFQHIPRLG